MLKAIGPSVTAPGPYAAPILTPANASLSGTSQPTLQRALPEALQRLVNVRVDVLPVVHERRPGAFVPDPPQRAHSGLARRMRRSRSLHGAVDLHGKHGDLGNLGARRVRRHVPERVVDMPNPGAQEARDDVAIKALPTFSVTASLSLRSLEEALSRCASPVSGLIRDAQLLYAVATDRTLSDNARRYLQGAGQIIDIVSSFHPTLGLVHGVCGLGARALEILRGSPVTEDDLLNVTVMMKDATRYRQDGRLPRDDGAFGVVDQTTPQRAKARDEPPSFVESSADGNDAPGPAETFEINYAEAADVELDAAGEGEAEAMSEDKVVAVGEGEAEIETVDEGKPPLENDVATVPKRVEIVSAQTPGASTSAYQQANSYAMIDTVPIVFVRGQGQHSARWQRMPLLAYAEPVRCPRGGKDGQLFQVLGIDFVQLDGLAYPFYAARRGSEFVYSVSHARLPPLPLEKHGSGRILKEPKLVALKDIGVFPGTDGFIRMNNKRYIVYGQIVVEATRPQLIGEVQIEQNAMVINVALSAPDARGLIYTPSAMKVIEGGNGYYRVQESVIPGEVDLLDPEGNPVSVRLKYDDVLRRWSISSDLRDAPLIRQASRDSLDVYQTKVDWSVFLRQRPKLQKSVSLMLEELQNYNLYRPNRLSPRAPGSKWITDIYSVRRAISHYLRLESAWDGLSVKERQRASSAATWRFFRDNQEWAWAPGSQAFCSEMLDIACAVMRNTGIGDRHLLQIVFHESPGSGRSHVAMLYADDPAVFGRFGEIDMPADHATLPAVEHHAFADWLLAHRETVAIIDPWGPEKVNDFSQAKDRAEVELRINVNLREAKFNMDGPVRYRVGALVPSREVKANQRVAVIASKDVSSERKAPCALLDGCL